MGNVSGNVEVREGGDSVSVGVGGYPYPPPYPSVSPYPLSPYPPGGLCDPRMRYTVGTFKVWYMGTEVAGVQPETFHDLSCGYGKTDFGKVFYVGLEIPVRMGINFRVLANGTATDGFDTYRYGRRIADVI